MPDVIKGNTNGIVINNEEVKVFHKNSIFNVPWSKHEVDVVIDASGIHSNVLNARVIKDIGKCIVTHSPGEELVDKSVIIGVNEKTIKKDDFLISSSICDANAFAPVINVLNKKFGVRHGFLTTLHPWLNYQNLLDGQAISFGYPGTTYGRYELGRASTQSLIPKPTSCITATCMVLPFLKNKFLSMSYRIPTTIVSSCDISVKLNNPATKEIITWIFNRQQKQQKYKIFYNNVEPLVSIDFAKSDYSAIVDHRWTMVNGDNYVKMVLWYDNEWGYSCRVVDLVNYIGENKL